MDILQLKFFVSVAHTLNFSKTADAFYTTQPSVSHHIRALEERLGVTLLQRNSHGVKLTTEGQEYLPYAEQILNLSYIGEQRVQNIAHGRIGRVRIAALSSTTYLLSDCLSTLYSNYPLIQVDVDMLDGTEMVTALARGSYDFYFATETMLPAGSKYHHSVLSSLPLNLFIPKKWEHEIDINDWTTVQDKPFVSVPMSDSILSTQIRTICKNRKCTPRIINYYNKAEAVVLSVNVGIGLAILPAELGNLYQRPNVVTHPIPGDDAFLTQVFAWQEGDSHSTAFGIFRDLVLQSFPEAPESTAKKRHISK